MLSPTGGSQKRICVLGNFSGRNAGDMAILGCLMHDITSCYSNITFVIPTINPRHVRESFPDYAVEPVSLLPWALSLKILGVPVFRAVLSSDVVLITDNILFDMKLFNPLFNYLSTLSFVVPIAKRRGIPVVLYNMSLGPINTRLGRYCLNQVITNSQMIILRDLRSKELLDNLRIPYNQIEIKADCALNTIPCNEERLRTIVTKENLFSNPKGTIGFNVNSYLNAYIRQEVKQFDRKAFCQLISQTVDVIVENMGLDVLFVVTQHMDISITKDIIGNVRHSEKVRLVSNHKYAYNDLAGIMGKLSLMVGMRTHSLILASAMNVPVIGLISYPKTSGYFTSIGQDRWTVRINDLTRDQLVSLIDNGYQQRQEIVKSLTHNVEAAKRKARESANMLGDLLNNNSRIDS